jgi:hypothetical protein
MVFPTPKDKKNKINPLGPEEACKKAVALFNKGTN